MLPSLFGVVCNVASRVTRHTNGICISAGTLVFSSVANGAFCGGRIFFSGGAKFATNVLVIIFTVVHNVASRVTRHTNGICNSVGTLVFSSIANGAFRGGRDIFFAGGATFAIVRRVVFAFSVAGVYNVTSIARGACNGRIHMSDGLVLATWAYGTIEESSNGCTFHVAAAWAIVNTTGVIVDHIRSSIPTIWTSRAGIRD